MDGYDTALDHPTEWVTFHKHKIVYRQYFGSICRDPEAAVRTSSDLDLDFVELDPPIELNLL
jgi:predicted nucleotidyltransferase